MQALVERIHGLVVRRWPVVLLVWLAVIAVSLPFAARQTEHLTSGGFSVPGSQSQRVDELLGRFERVPGGAAAIVIEAAHGSSTRAVERELERAAGIVERFRRARLAAGAYAAAKGRLARASDGARLPRGLVLVLPVQLGIGDSDASADAAELRRQLGVGRRGQVALYFAGEGGLSAALQEQSRRDLHDAELVGFPLIAFVLLRVFGSFAAMGLPLALGFAAVSLAGAVIWALSQLFTMSVFVTNMASMIGLGVAVDYSLFVLARYREELARGAARREALRVALGTSGIAVAFAGVTVVLALASLFLVDSRLIRSMAAGAVIVVVLSIAGALTLLPALALVAGRRLRPRPGLLQRARSRVARRRGGRGRDEERYEGADSGPWQRWTEAVVRRPLLAALASAALMLALAAPALSMRLGDGIKNQLPADSFDVRGQELAERVLGPRASGPLLVAFEARGANTFSRPPARAELERWRRWLARQPHVAVVERPLFDRARRTALIAVYSRGGAESAGARALLGTLRSQGAERIATTARLSVGGATAAMEDFRALVAGSLWKVLVFVAGLSSLVLVVLLRSLVLPLKAAVMNLLSVGAAYGVLTAVFQHGWLEPLGVAAHGHVHSVTPTLLLAITFGLSMDYEVFLLTRVKERYAVHGDTVRAVAEGLQASARTISSAALIMVAVFAVFAFVGVPTIREMGLGLAVAIALDATVVRLVLVPAMMVLFGRWNWWLPAWLERLLPRVDAHPEVRAPALAAHES